MMEAATTTSRVRDEGRLNYCNRPDDDMDATDQCGGADGPDRATTARRSAPAHLLAFWSSIAIVVLLVPSVIWTFASSSRTLKPYGPTVQAVEMATVQARRTRRRAYCRPAGRAASNCATRRAADGPGRIRAGGAGEGVQ